MALGNALGMHEKTARSFWNAWSVYRKSGKSRGRLMAYVSTDLEGGMILGEPCPFYCLHQSQTLFSPAEHTKTCCDLATASSPTSFSLFHTLSVQSWKSPALHGAPTRALLTLLMPASPSHRLWPSALCMLWSWCWRY